MGIHEGLTARTEGCSALLLDRGNGRPDIPACMGAISIDGANSSVVGCVDYDVCRDKVTQITGKIRRVNRDESGTVVGEYEINRDIPQRY